MDGTYISDGDIISGESQEFYYTTETIRCSNIERVKARNKHKREIMNYLLTVNDIKGISYKCYYLSTNLDNALYGILNMSDEDKQLYAQKFYEAFMEK